MIAVQICVEWLVTFIENAFYFSIVRALAPEQFKRKKQTFLFFAVASVITTGIILLNLIDLSFSLATIIYFCLALSFGACILFRGNFVGFLSVSVIYLTGLGLVEGSVLGLIERFSDQGFSEQYQSFSTLRIYILIVLKLIDSLVMLVVHFILKKAKVTLKQTEKALIGAVLGFLCAGYWLSAITTMTNFKIDMIQTILALAFIFILCSVYFYDQIRRIRQEQENTALQNRLLTKNYQMAKSSYESNARLYHDMGNHFSMLQNYLADGKVEEAQAYLKRISGDRAAYSVECRTGIEAVDYILSQKMEVALQHNIETTIHAEYPKDCNIDPVDLCTILTNLLDNAIEACGRMPEGSDKKLTVTIRRIKRFIIIRIENSSLEEPVINKGNFLTSKQDRRNHGWGMRNVKSAVEKYHGAIEYEYFENMFTVSVMLFYQ
ncbi:MAG: GHKL domain-containing protein [Lachnospiraceae bacterium]|nr:GHKL domain-containing protein [Lachnospiraceae bacterium]